MSLIMQFLGITPTRNPDDERWWGGTQTTAISGVTVNADIALTLSTVWACTMLLAETIASLPLFIYQVDTNNNTRERARNHPLYDVVHSQPNQWQTASEFRQMMTTHMLLRGNAYARIVPGARGAVDQLLPIHPDLVTVERLPNGRLRYSVTQEDGQPPKRYNQEDIFHVRGPSQDGITGMSVIDYSRNSLGLGLATHNYGSKFFRNDSRPGGVLRMDGRVSKDAAERLKASWESAHSGGNNHRVAILEEGLQWQAIGIAPDEAQFLGTIEANAEDVCRWFRVPPHMVGLTSKQTSWGTGIEEQTIGFLTFTLMPWLTRWKEAISRDLILAPQIYFAEFVVEGLLRGNIEGRYNAYATGRQWGWLSVNDIRRLENMNPVDNGDVYLQPLNMSEAGVPVDTPSAAAFDAPHYRLLAEENAGRVVRKEIAVMTKAAARFTNYDEFAEFAALFYGDHAAYVAQTMRISLDAATAYCELNRSELIEYGVAAMDDWQPRRINALADLATGGTRE